VWMARTGTRLLAGSLGLIVGGAIGNAVDRIAYGAVFDFVHLHAGTWSWYVFNVADAGIVLGVVGLLYDALWVERRQAGEAPSDA
jgi:signal peptidase II